MCDDPLERVQIADNLNAYHVNYFQTARRWQHDFERTEM